MKKIFAMLAALVLCTTTAKAEITRSYGGSGGTDSYTDVTQTIRDVRQRALEYCARNEVHQHDDCFKAIASAKWTQDVQLSRTYNSEMQCSIDYYMMERIAPLAPERYQYAFSISCQQPYSVRNWEDDDRSTVVDIYIVTAFHLVTVVDSDGNKVNEGVAVTHSVGGKDPVTVMSEAARKWPHSNGPNWGPGFLDDMYPGLKKAADSLSGFEYWFREETKPAGTR